MQDCSNSIANALELLQSCTEQLIHQILRSFYGCLIVQLLNWNNAVEACTVVKLCVAFKWLNDLVSYMVQIMVIHGYFISFYILWTWGIMIALKQWRTQATLEKSNRLWIDWCQANGVQLFGTHQDLPIWRLIKFYNAVSQHWVSKSLMFSAVNDNAVQQTHAAFRACSSLLYWLLNTLRLRQNGRYFPDDIFECIFLKENFQFRLKFHWSLFPRVQLTIFQHWFR